MFGGRRTRGQLDRSWNHCKIKGKGKAIQAIRDIKPGERITAEEPLVTFPDIPEDVIDQNQILMSRKTRPGKKIANGMNMIAAELENLPEDKLRALRALHGPQRSIDDDEDDESDLLTWV